MNSLVSDDSTTPTNLSFAIIYNEYNYQAYLMRIKSSLFGWEETGLDVYRKCHYELNGNASSDPDLLNFQHQIYNIKHRYMIKVDNKENILAAICVWDDKYLANDPRTSELTSSESLPISSNELVLPISKDAKIILPFKTKILSSLHGANILNSTFRFNARRKICIARNPLEFSSKTRQTRKRELKKFMEMGGEILDVENFDAKTTMYIFDDLFYKRRGKHAINLSLNIELIKSFPEKFVGKILFMHGKPCAMQLITKSECKGAIFFDYINIGLDTALKNLSLGTVLTWVNLNHASEMCVKTNKAMRFSFGRPTFDYKARWCDSYELGRSLVI